MKDRMPTDHWSAIDGTEKGQRCITFLDRETLLWTISHEYLAGAMSLDVRGELEAKYALSRTEYTLQYDTHR